jgi:hypothetical protein
MATCGDEDLAAFRKDTLAVEIKDLAVPLLDSPVGKPV